MYELAVIEPYYIRRILKIEYSCTQKALSFQLYYKYIPAKAMQGQSHQM